MGIKKLLTFLFLLVSLATSAQTVRRFSTQEINDALSAYDSATTDYINEFRKFKASEAEFRETVVETLEDLILDGKLTEAEKTEILSYFDSIKGNSLYNGVYIPPDMTAWAARNNFRAVVANKLNQYNILIPCAGANAVVNGKVCCNQDHVIVPDPIKMFNEMYMGTCKKSFANCSNSTECCSQICKIETGQTTGQCEPIKKCFAQLPTGADCTANPICDSENGIKCLSVAGPDYGVGACQAVGGSCTSGSECCTGTCQTVQGVKRCYPKNKCMKCASWGVAPSAGKPCCPGLYRSGYSGRCVPDLNPGF